MIGKSNRKKNTKKNEGGVFLKTGCECHLHLKRRTWLRKGRSHIPLPGVASINESAINVSCGSDVSIRPDVPVRRLYGLRGGRYHHINYVPCGLNPFHFVPWIQVYRNGMDLCFQLIFGFVYLVLRSGGGIAEWMKNSV